MLIIKLLNHKLWVLFESKENSLRLTEIVDCCLKLSKKNSSSSELTFKSVKGYANHL